MSMREAWWGKEKLWRVFWIYGIAVFLLVPAVLCLIAFVLIWAMPEILIGVAFFGSGDFLGSAVILLALRLLATLFTPYLIWWGIALWRCAPNSGKKTWEILAKIFVVILGLRVAYGIASIAIGSMEVAELKNSGCIIQMTNYAKAHGLEPHRYIRENPAILKQCLRDHATGNTANDTSK